MSHSVGFKGPRELRLYCEDQAVLDKVDGSCGHSNATGHNAEPIFTGLHHSKYANFLKTDYDA